MKIDDMISILEQIKEKRGKNIDINIIGLNLDEIFKMITAIAEEEGVVETKVIETKGVIEEFSVIRQEWEESEAGWGIRPDGCSLHLNNELLKEFIDEYWAKMPDETPECYSRPSGNPTVIVVDKKTFNKIKKSKNGIWSS